MKNNYIKYFSEVLNKKKIILLITVILILLGSFLRLYGLNKVYTEYDDIGVISIHKAHIGNKNISFSNGYIDAKFELKMENISSIENNFLLPFYIAYSWTYAPAQYLITPLLINNTDDFDLVVYKARLISVIFSVLSIILLAYLMYLINGNTITWIIPIVLTLPIFSANSILYAHHMSPYSAYFFSTSFCLFFLYQYYISKLSLRKLIIILSFFLYLSYMVVLFAIPTLFIYIYKVKNQRIYQKWKKFFRDFVSILIGVLISSPALVIIMHLYGNYSYGNDSGERGSMPEEILGIATLLNNTSNAIKQFYLSMQSLLNGSIRYDYLFFLLFTITVLLLLKKLFKKNEALNNSGIYITSISTIIFQWIILNIMGILPSAGMRYGLIIFPIIVILIFYALKDITLKPFSIFALLLVIVSSIGATNYSIGLLKSKYSNFDYSLLDARDEKIILLYQWTLGPLKYYDNSEKKVYSIDMNSFQANYQTIDFPDTVLLVSQDKKIFSNNLLDDYKERLPIIFCNYSIKILYEKDSNVFFSASNQSFGSQKNGMFIYQLNKIETDQC